MARTSLTKTNIPGPYADVGAVVTMTAADTSNQNRIVFTGREIVIARNSGASTRTVTFTSSADSFGRTNDLGAENILTGEIKVYGPGLALPGWVQTDTGVNYLYLEANHAEVLFGVLVLP